MREVDVAKPVVAYMEDYKWDVYKEVPCHSGVADIVGVLDGRIWIVETKTSLSVQLIDQAISRRQVAHYISIAVPRPKRYSYSPSIELVLDHYGIGLITVRGEEVNIDKQVKLFRHVSKDKQSKLLASLRPEMKDNEAGSIGAKRWTSFKRFRSRVVALVEKNPGIAPRKLIQMMQPDIHYHTESTALHCLVHYIRKGIINEIILVKEKGKLRLFPCSVAE